MLGSKFVLGLSLLWINSALFVAAQNPVTKKGACDVNTDDLKCHYDCGADQLQNICLQGECYCTNVGQGSCKTGPNNEGCNAVCQSTGKASGSCFLGQCTCK